MTPTRFGLHIMLYVLVWVIVGGTRTFYGPILGVVTLSILDEFIREFDEYRPLIYGLILILTVRFLPQGLESVVLRRMKTEPVSTVCTYRRDNENPILQLFIKEILPGFPGAR